MSIFTDNADFYPTPKAVIEKMMLGENIFAKKILEPSAGNGNIVDWLKENGAAQVIACEKDPNIRKLLQGKCEIIADDFLTVTPEQVSHIDYIVMNPPFSEGAKHILHAFDIAPAGCTIIALCNSDNLSSLYYSKTKRMLSETVNLYGQREALGDVFKTAERSTGVNVELIKLYKDGEGSNEFDGYFFDQYDTDAAGGSTEGIMQYNFVRDIVARYVQAVKLFDSAMQTAKAINDLADFHDYTTITDEATGKQEQVRNDYGILPVRFGAILYDAKQGRTSECANVTHAQYKKYLQKHYWKIIFAKLNMEKYATEQLRKDINKFVEQQSHIPFTMGNIYRVLDIVIQTNGQRMLKALEEAFDTICSFSAENSTAGETWKTNANYMVNRKFIVPDITGWDYGKFGLSYDRYTYGKVGKIEDVCKALCTITGRDYNTVGSLRDGIRKNPDADWGKWFEWGFFRCKGFKKGTMHFEFLDEDVWYRFNYEVSKLKGWALPKKTQKRKAA